MKTRQKQTKIGTKRVFSYKKAKNKVRKRRGLSPVSTLGLTLAFNNRNVGKKVVLIFIITIMIAMIFGFTSVIFSSTESAFCNIMNSNNAPYVVYRVYGNADGIAGQTQKTNEYIRNKYGKESYVKSFYGLQQNNLQILPAPNAVLPKYERAISFNMGGFIYVDSPQNIGLEIIKGEAPKINNLGVDEIAISKTHYNYLKEVKYFYDKDGQVVDLSKDDFLGKNIFGVIICGVFDDHNEIDMNSEVAMELDFLSYNSLISTKLMHKDAAKYLRSVLTYQSDYAMCIGEGESGFFSFYPKNDSAKRFFQGKDFPDPAEPMSKNEIYVGYDFVMGYYRATGVNLAAGDTVSMQVVKTKHQSFRTYIDKQLYETQNFKIKRILDCAASVVVHEELYNEWITPLNLPVTNEFVISSKNVTPSMLKDIRRFVNAGISTNDSAQLTNENNTFSIDYDMIKYNGSYDDWIFAARIYMALPLSILAAVVVGVLLSVLMVDVIQVKAKEILVLRSLGMRQKDIAKIFVWVILFMLAVLLVCGVLLGLAFTYGLNKFWEIFGDYSFYAPTFFVSPLSVGVMLLMLLGVTAAALGYSVQRLYGKNFRRLFQKIKS